jgi:NADH:ubiquinone oxidoreductase subunit 3 (subunit A)
MIAKLLLSPPAAFVILLVAGILFLLGISMLGVRKPKGDNDQNKPYACGENVTKHRLQPEYSQFFSFAFFFTIMHVIALFVATVPKAPAGIVGISVIYLGCAALGLYILRRN